MSAEKFFIENINVLPKVFGGKPQDPHTWNTQQGLLAMAKQLTAIQAQQVTILRAIAEMESRLYQSGR